MPYKFNPFTRQLDYYETAAPSGGGQITSLSLIFCESFIGDGGTTVFPLTGALDNAAFSTGSWTLFNVGFTLPSHITDIENKALYDSSNIFTKTRIQIESINGSNGIVTLSEPPQFLEEFKIWYWYTLSPVDVLSFYRREEFVASMEGDISSTDIIAAQNIVIDTSNFNEILSSSEDTVQKALDLLDNHVHGTIITDTLIEDLSLTSFYVGHATNNATTSEPFWQIKKVIETGDVINFYFADGTENYDKIWDNRSSYNYI